MALSSVGVLVGLAVLLPAEMVNAPAVAASAGRCTGWNSTTRPPDYIRVLRRQSGQVDRVPFRQYVVTVMGKEWPGYLPQAVIDAGAVAVKQYAWWHSLGSGRVSRRGQCFDVTDGVGDQLYKPNRARIRQDHYTALNATWNVRLLKSGSLFMTGYRTGSKGACGHDATGWKLYARSAVRCARRGMNYQQILRIYYGPVSVVSGGGSSNVAGDTAGSPDTSALTIDMGSTPAAPADTTAADTTAPADTTTPAVAAPLTPQVGTSSGVVLDTDVPVPDTMPIGERAFTQG